MYIIGVAGGSGSGKTTFSEKIISRVSHEDAAVLHQDCYYSVSPPPEIKVHGASNFDHPLAFDWELLKLHLRQIKEGGSIQVPVYDYENSQRTSETQEVGPCKVLIVEGIFSLWDEHVRNTFDLKVYLSVAADIRFIRRLHRDAKERGRSLDGIIRQYYDSVRPMHREFLEPTSQYADLVVGEETDIAAEVLATKVSSIIKGN
mgnify:CR=1 FL=1